MLFSGVSLYPDLGILTSAGMALELPSQRIIGMERFGRQVGPQLAYAQKKWHHFGGGGRRGVTPGGVGMELSDL